MTNDELRAVIERARTEPLPFESLQIWERMREMLLATAEVTERLLADSEAYHALLRERVRPPTGEQLDWAKTKAR